MPRSVLVTGATSGIGLATVMELAGAGWDVVGSARSQDKAAQLREVAEQRGVALRTVVLDVDDAASCRSGVESAQELTGGLSALVNNAGYAQSGAVEDVTDEMARAQLETNVVGPARLARLVLAGMRERGQGGHIVNVSSVAGRLSLPLMGWYCASKHALEALTDALRMEVEGDGVRVVLVEPGMFGTDIWSAAEEGGFPTPTTARYAAAYARAESLGGRDRLPDPVWVARTIRLALSNPLPLARYVVGVDAVGGILSETIVPTAVTDYVKLVAAGLRRVPLRVPFLPR